MTDTPQSILIVDDDEMLRMQLSRALQKRGYSVLEAGDYDAAIEILNDHTPDRAVLDLRMPGRSGLELLRELKKRSPDTEAVVLTGYGSITNAVDAIKLGAVNYVTKPADTVAILHAFSSDAKSGAPDAQREFPPQSLAEAEWEYIHRILAECGGNISEAARRLDIPRRTLQRKLRKLSP